jgi:hypothetical protein
MNRHQRALAQLDAAQAVLARKEKKMRQAFAAWDKARLTVAAWDKRCTKLFAESATAVQS